MKQENTWYDNHFKELLRKVVIFVKMFNLTSEHQMSQNYNKEKFRSTVKSLRGMTEYLQYSNIMEIIQNLQTDVHPPWKHTELRVNARGAQNLPFTTTDTARNNAIVRRPRSSPRTTHGWRSMYWWDRGQEWPFVLWCRSEAAMSQCDHAPPDQMSQYPTKTMGVNKIFVANVVIAQRRTHTEFQINSQGPFGF